MAKKVIEEVEIKEEKKVLAPLTVDFGRADLNALRDAVNELIARS